MRLPVTAIALGLSLIAGSAAAQNMTYSFTSAPYNPANITVTPGACIGECEDYTINQRATVVLNLDGPLGNNLADADISGMVLSYSLDDGRLNAYGPSPIGSLPEVKVSTDGSGIITDFTIEAQRTPGTSYAVNNANDPEARYSFIRLTPTSILVGSNHLCTSRGASGPLSGAGNCLTGAPSNGSTTISSITTVTAVGAVTVPTLTEWAMILLASLLAGTAAFTLWQRRRTA